MSDDLEEKMVNKKIASLLSALPRRRGRPPTGFAKAIKYSDEYFALRVSGMSPWRAKQEVARRNRKTPEHISACVKMIDETPGHEFWMHDETED
jgi:hypothetical protein